MALDIDDAEITTLNTFAGNGLLRDRAAANLSDQVRTIQGTDGSGVATAVQNLADALKKLFGSITSVSQDMSAYVTRTLFDLSLGNQGNFPAGSVEESFTYVLDELHACCQQATDALAAARAALDARIDTLTQDTADDFADRDATLADHKTRLDGLDTALAQEVQDRTDGDATRAQELTDMQTAITTKHDTDIATVTSSVTALDTDYQTTKGNLANLQTAYDAHIASQAAKDLAQDNLIANKASGVNTFRVVMGQGINSDVNPATATASTSQTPSGADIVVNIDNVIGKAGADGKRGPKGDPILLSHTYASDAMMNLDVDNLVEGQVVAVADGTSTRIYYKDDNGQMSLLTTFSSVQGVQGPQGPQGEQGERGEQGSPGQTGPMGPAGPSPDITSINASIDQTVGTPAVTTAISGNSTIGYTFDFAFSGLMGEKGEKGEQGDPIKIVNAFVDTQAMQDDIARYLIGDMVIIANNGGANDGYIYIKTAQGWQFAFDMHGVTGLVGPTGAKGDTGARGAKGDKGDTGATGEKGDPSATFTLNGNVLIIDDTPGALLPYGVPQASIGTQQTNPTVTVAQAVHAGEKILTFAFDGLIGPTGAKGDKGDKGDTGATGAKGVTASLSGNDLYLTYN